MQVKVEHLLDSQRALAYPSGNLTMAVPVSEIKRLARKHGTTSMCMESYDSRTGWYLFRCLECGEMFQAARRREDTPRYCPGCGRLVEP